MLRQLWASIVKGSTTSTGEEIIEGVETVKRGVMRTHVTKRVWDIYSYLERYT
jgi:hypothetical protein